MQSSLIGKIEKAKRYAQEPDRVTLSEFSAGFRGDHNSYTVSYKDKKMALHLSFLFAAGDLQSYHGITAAFRRSITHRGSYLSGY